MTIFIKCPECNGTGKIKCEVHEYHTCDRCNGKGCINMGFTLFPKIPYCSRPELKFWDKDPWRCCQ